MVVIKAHKPMDYFQNSPDFGKLKINYYETYNSYIYYGAGKSGKGYDYYIQGKKLMGSKAKANVKSLDVYYEDEKLFSVFDMNISYKEYSKLADDIGDILKGNDKFTGSAGDDMLPGLDGKDVIYGEGGNDKIWGGAGNDSIFGGSGNDKLSGGTGYDKLVGGTGKDIFVLSKGKGYAKIKDFTTEDSLKVIGVSKKKIKTVKKGNDVLIFGKKDLLARVEGGVGKKLF